MSLFMLPETVKLLMCSKERNGQGQKWTERDRPKMNRARIKGPVFDQYWTVPYHSLLLLYQKTIQL